MIALLPARAGSERVRSKNLRILAGKPLIAWAVRAAVDSGCFEQVVVSTDSDEIADAAYAEADVQIVRRHEALATATSPDFVWFQHVFSHATELPRDTCAILRPTSPFRTAETIRRAYKQFTEGPKHIHSLRAVRKVREHPAKMWMLEPGRRKNTAIWPYRGSLDPEFYEDFYPDASRPYQALEADYGPIYVQDSSLEMAYTKVILETGLLSGTRVMPFFTEGYEGYSVDYEDDLILAEALLARGLVRLG